MHCFYLAKSDGVGYRNRLKAIWDTRNPLKTTISVNMLCCHARNIQSSNMLSEFELSNTVASCTNKTSCAGGDVTNVSNSQGNDSIVEPAVDRSPISRSSVLSQAYQMLLRKLIVQSLWIVQLSV